jgi:Electron transfer DM13
MIIFFFSLKIGWSQRDDRYGRLIGQLNNFAHGIAGTVYAVSDEALFIKGFEYDGTGPGTISLFQTASGPV